MGETYGGNLWGKPMGETYGGNLWGKPMGETAPNAVLCGGTLPNAGYLYYLYGVLKRNPGFLKIEN
jgi:hypothetical protein